MYIKKLPKLLVWRSVWIELVLLIFKLSEINASIKNCMVPQRFFLRMLCLGCFHLGFLFLQFYLYWLRRSRFHWSWSCLLWCSFHWVYFVLSCFHLGFYYFGSFYWCWLLRSSYHWSWSRLLWCRGQFPFETFSLRMF